MIRGYLFPECPKVFRGQAENVVGKAMTYIIQPAIGHPSANVEVPLTGDLRLEIANPDFALMLGQVEGEIPTPETPPPLVPPPPPALPTGSEEANLVEPNARGTQPDFFLPTESVPLTHESPVEHHAAPEEEEPLRKPPESTPAIVLANLLGLLPFTPAYAIPAAHPLTETVETLATQPSEVVRSVLPAMGQPVDETDRGVELSSLGLQLSNEVEPPAVRPSAPATGVERATIELKPGEALASRNKTSPTAPIAQESGTDRVSNVPAPIPNSVATPKAMSETERLSPPRTPEVTSSPPSTPVPQAPSMPIAGSGVLQLLNPIEIRVREGAAAVAMAQADPEAATPAPNGPLPSGPRQAAEGATPVIATLTPQGNPVAPTQTAELLVSARPPQEAVGPVSVETPEAAPALIATAVPKMGSAEPSSGAPVPILSDQPDQSDQSDVPHESDTSDQPVRVEKSHASDPTSHPVAPTSQPTGAHRPKPVIEPEAISRRIADRIEELFFTRRSGTVTIQLDPKDLGSITLTVRSFGNRVDAEIGASHEGVRAALAENRQQLSQSIESRGLSLGQLSLSDHGEFSQGTPWNRSDAREDLQRYANVRLADDPNPARSDATSWSVANDQSVDYRI